MTCVHFCAFLLRQKEVEGPSSENSMLTRKTESEDLDQMWTLEDEVQLQELKKQ